LNYLTDSVIVYVCVKHLRSTAHEREDQMADGDDRIKLESAVQLIFNDASRTVSDLKSRQWSATTLSVAGIIGIVTFIQKKPSGMPPCVLTGFVGLIPVGYGLVMWRCATNLSTLRLRLKTIINGTFPDAAKGLFDEKFKNAVVDEGSIVGISVFLVLGAFVFAMLDIWKY
jgi:hypothetical protein